MNAINIAYSIDISLQNLQKHVLSGKTDLSNSMMIN